MSEYNEQTPPPPSTEAEVQQDQERTWDKKDILAWFHKRRMLTISRVAAKFFTKIHRNSPMLDRITPIIRPFCFFFVPNSC